jgi:methylmalonyl-CoA/ethylmalonyl-CoA epimerase
MIFRDYTESMLKAINVIGMYVSDTMTSVSFYKDLGFEVISDDGIIGRVKLGGFELDFMAKDTAKNLSESFQKDAFGEPKGTGIYINVEVNKIDAYFKQIKELGIEPSTEPKDWPWGQREFVVRDPDRYKIVFYQKLR